MPLAKNLMSGGFSAGQAKALGGTQFNLTITAAGTTQGTATALTADTNVITTATANQGVQIYNGEIADSQVIFNQTLVPIYVYPPTGDAVNQLAANSGFVLAPQTGVIVEKVSNSQWIGILSA